MTTIITLFFLFAPPMEQRTPPEELVERTPNIILAKCTQATYLKDKGIVRYSFTPLEAIKGTTPKNISIIGHTTRYNQDIRDFNNHTDEKFWNDHSVGRCEHDSDGQIRPPFAVGNDYLLFLDAPYHNKGFEVINSKTRDKWLKWVKDRVRVQHPNPPNP